MVNRQSPKQDDENTHDDESVRPAERNEDKLVHMFCPLSLFRGLQRILHDPRATTLIYLCFARLLLAADFVGLAQEPVAFRTSPE
jgi:hypothetical protein